jgi:hypothetical protein
MMTPIVDFLESLAERGGHRIFYPVQPNRTQRPDRLTGGDGIFYYVALRVKTG